MSVFAHCTKLIAYVWVLLNGSNVRFLLACPHGLQSFTGKSAHVADLKVEPIFLSRCLAQDVRHQTFL